MSTYSLQIWRINQCVRAQSIHIPIVFDHPLPLWLLNYHHFLHGHQLSCWSPLVELAKAAFPWHSILHRILYTCNGWTQYPSLRESSKRKAKQKQRFYPLQSMNWACSPGPSTWPLIVESDRNIPEFLLNCLSGSTQDGRFGKYVSTDQFF